jgi:TctA family transporter
MDLFSNLVLGLSFALTAQNLGYCFLGALLGTLIGVLPGLGPVATIAMLLPATFALPPNTALIMLAGIYYGAQYGGSTTAILIKLPGESSSVVTALDGHEMAKRGRAGTALATAALASLFAGCVSTLLIGLFSPPLAEVAMRFRAPEYFSLMVLGLVSSVALASGSILKALAMVVLGLLLGLVGRDMYTSVPRYTFGTTGLLDGLEFVAVAMGVFGIAEIIHNLSQRERRGIARERLGGLRLTGEDVRRATPATLRGTALGSLLGVLPGGGAMLASFAAYALEKKVSTHRAEMGQGAIEGVAAPESANNAGAQTSFIPMLTLGIPSNPVMALMIGAMIVHGITPGPNVISSKPDLFWGLVASMWVGNLMLVVLNLPLIGLWIRLLTIPYSLIMLLIVAFCCVGVYSVNRNVTDIYVMAAFGAAGYLLLRLGCEPAPFLLGFVISPMLEQYLRRAMLVSRGDPVVFVTSPISALLLSLAALAIVLSVLPAIRRRREEALRE